MPRFRHPEQREDEVFFGNFCWGPFCELDWDGKRMGILAYDQEGNLLANRIDPLDTFHPVFLPKQELQGTGLDPDRFEAHSDSFTPDDARFWAELWTGKTATDVQEYLDSIRKLRTM